jgi:hypothetical protein
MALPRLLSAALGAVCLSILGTAGAVTPDKHPTVVYSSHHDVSAPMRDIVRNMPPESPMGTDENPFLIPNILLKPNGIAGAKPYLPAIQRAPIGVPAPAIDLSFEAVSAAQSGCGCLPPDTNGDVSDQHYIQWVNTRWAVFDKTDGSVVQAATNGNSFWVGFGGKCQTTNSGDPIALWDPRAQRWVMSQFVTSTPYAQCVAVSTTSDPLGTYNRYEFDWPASNFGDYPKMAVWTDGGGQDAYLLTTHEFTGQAFDGAAFIAMDRDAMVAGAPTAAMVRFGGFDAYGVEPINLVGQMNAPTNSCGGYVHFDANTSEYLFWDICLDWTTPANTTVSADPTRIQGAPFVPYFDEVPQQGSSAGLDPFGTHIMYRANARAFPADAPTRVSLVVNHVVQGDVQQGGINWIHFNLDDHGQTFATPTPLDKTLLQEGVYAPDAENRWMGGIAIDGSGNIGVGFSKSSADMHPQVMISGRTSEDPPGTLEDEQNCTDGIGNGSQTSTSNRWGDYSSMSVDPVDQCTFYYTNEYYPATAGAQWHTRGCSFKFPNCGQPDFALVPQTPPRIEMCGATTSTDPSWSIRAGVLNGFTGSVALTASGVPAGATADFAPNPLTAPGTTTLTLTGGAALPSGEYAMTVDGTSGADTRTLGISLGVSATAPTAPQLTSPPDSATEVKVRPLLVWGGTPPPDEIFADGFDGGPIAPRSPAGSTGALSYTVDVATDSSFTNIVTSATVETTQWNVDITLDATTQYYWRVTPHNYCGDGAVSATFSFTTGVPGQCPSGTTATVLYSDDFESGVNGWLAGGTGDVGWTQAAAPSGTGMSTTTWQVPDNDTTSDRTLDTPTLALPASAVSVILAFDAYHNAEQNGPGACWDLSSMEYSTDGTTYTYLDGTHFFTDPYNGVGSNDTPVGAREGWCYPGPAGSNLPTHSIVDLDGFIGQTIQLRYRMTSDSNTTAQAPNGLIIDNFQVTVCQ